MLRTFLFNVYFSTKSSQKRLINTNSKVNCVIVTSSTFFFLFPTLFAALEWMCRQSFVHTNFRVKVNTVNIYLKRWVALVTAMRAKLKCSTMRYFIMLTMSCPLLFVHPEGMKMEKTKQKWHEKIEKINEKQNGINIRICCFAVFSSR